MKNVRKKVFNGDCDCILVISVAPIRRKLLKTTHTEERIASIQIQKVAIFDSNRKKINLIPNKSFRYYNL